MNFYLWNLVLENVHAFLCMVEKISTGLTWGQLRLVECLAAEWLSSVLICVFAWWWAICWTPQSGVFRSPGLRPGLESQLGPCRLLTQGPKCHLMGGGGIAWKQWCVRNWCWLWRDTQGFTKWWWFHAVNLTFCSLLGGVTFEPVLYGWVIWIVMAI